MLPYIVARNMIYQQVILVNAEDAGQAVRIVKEAEYGPEINVDHPYVEETTTAFIAVETEDKWYVAPLNVDASFQANANSLLAQVYEFMCESLLDDSPLALDIAAFLRRQGDPDGQAR